MASFAQDPKFQLLRSACEENATLLRSNCGAAGVNQHGLPWKLSHANKELNLEVYYSQEPNSPLTRFLGKCLFEECKPEELLQVMLDNPRRLTWDSNSKHIDSHPLYQWPVEGSKEPLRDMIHIFLVETNAVGPISSRDFIDINFLSHEIDANGEVASVTSVGGQTSSLSQILQNDYFDVFPEKSGVVRGLSSAGSGWYATRDGPNTLLHYVIHSDLKGYFPSWLINNSVGGTYSTFFKALKASILKDGYSK